MAIGRREHQGCLAILGFRIDVGVRLQQRLYDVGLASLRRCHQGCKHGREMRFPRVEVPDQKPQGYINDYAGVLSTAMEQRLESLADELAQMTGAQLAVVIIDSLKGERIEDYSIRLASRWQLGGSRGKGATGVLLLLAIKDRRNRIEISYGLEHTFPDWEAGSILRSLRPPLRKANYDAAILLGVRQIADIILSSPLLLELSECQEVTNADNANP